MEGIDYHSRCQVVIDALERWFWAIEKGTAERWLPNPKGKRYTEAEINVFIEGIDSEFEYELAETPNYHAEAGMKTRGVPMELPPDFNRLVGASREAFMQDIKQVAEDAFEGYEEIKLASLFEDDVVLPYYEGQEI